VTLVDLASSFVHDDIHVCKKVILLYVYNYYYLRGSTYSLGIGAVTRKRISC